MKKIRVVKRLRCKICTIICIKNFAIFINLRQPFNILLEFFVLLFQFPILVFQNNILVFQIFCVLFGFFRVMYSLTKIVGIYRHFDIRYATQRVIKTPKGVLWFGIVLKCMWAMMPGAFKPRHLVYVCVFHLCYIFYTSEVFKSFFSLCIKRYEKIRVVKRLRCKICTIILY